MAKKTEFLTKDAINSRTPLWAKNMFRITLALTSVATFVIASDSAISPELALRIGVYLKATDLFVYAISKSFGVTIES